MVFLSTLFSFYWSFRFYPQCLMWTQRLFLFLVIHILFPHLDTEANDFSFLLIFTTVNESCNTWHSILLHIFKGPRFDVCTLCIYAKFINNNSFSGIWFLLLSPMFKKLIFFFFIKLSLSFMVKHMANEWHHSCIF